ncbi:uncharacterized protein LOC121736204 [Aricia agestis]|uniref:uncharacterized protein LOC121729584 n=1 Tax=Aricia agestis TaxID=91739 RepID=UPI001C20B6A9|nr:uncharacterized protein LOC121729584 [Aricia agestis]XP_041979478.1 uncharacterized protein LOC121733327 [Aricia agestis]XP_041983227.1 uncharacterized protein LOC121736204 [Aricia agestis]
MMHPAVAGQFPPNPAPANPTTQAVIKTEESNLATISVSTRIPEFWVELPRLWFAQFEATMNPQKQGDDCKFQLVISKLGRDALQQVSDIVYKPPDSNKYQALKDRLLQVFEESPERQFQRLVSELDLGSQKPSQLLRKMRELARNCQASEETVQSLWFSRLPPAVRAVLAASADQKLDNLSPIADKVMESMHQTSLTGELANIGCHSAQVSVDKELCTQMNNLMLEVAALRNEVRRKPRFNFRGRSRSRSRSRYGSNSVARTPESPDWLCHYHFRFGARSRRCEEPCNFNKRPSAEN